MNHAAIIQDAIACAGSHKGLPEGSGCYVITNKVTGRVYVGQSANVRKRAADHLKALRRGDHCSAAMQQDYAEHGDDSFAFAVAVQCDEAERLDVERELIKTAANGAVYNTVVFDAMSNAEKARNLRVRRSDDGLAEIRGLWLPVELHDLARTLMRAEIDAQRMRKEGKK